MRCLRSFLILSLTLTGCVVIGEGAFVCRDGACPEGLVCSADDLCVAEVSAEGEGEGEGEGSDCTGDVVCEAYEACGVALDATMETLGSADADRRCITSRACPPSEDLQFTCEGGVSMSQQHEGCIASIDRLREPNGCPEAPALDYIRAFVAHWGARTCFEYANAEARHRLFFETCAAYSQTPLSCASPVFVGDVDGEGEACVVSFGDCADGKEYRLDCSTSTRSETGHCGCMIDDGSTTSRRGTPFEISRPGENFCVDSSLIIEMAKEKCRWFPE